MRALPLLAALVACRTEAPATEYHVEAATSSRVPARAGDPLVVDVELSRTLDGEPVALCGGENLADSAYGCEPEFEGTPVVVDAIGGPVALEALVDVTGARFAWTVQAPPGVYQVVGVEEVDGVEFDEPLGFELLDWGSASPFTKTSVAGLWSVVDYHTMPQDFDGSSFHPPVAVELSGVDEEGADVRIVLRYPEQDCVGMRMRATWAGSELTWAEDSLTVEHPDLGTLTAEELAISIAWRSGQDAPDVRASARLDTAPYAPLLSNADPQPDDVCDLLAMVQGVCAPCDFADSDYCVGLRAYEGVMERSEETLPAELPLCGLTFQPIGPIEWSCDIEPVDCSCATGGPQVAWGVLVGAAVALRRRRVSA